MHKLRAAVVGVGFVGRAHVEALRRLGISVTGILGSSAERGQQTARAIALDRAYTSLDELVSDPGVDVVHICTPNHLHFDLAKALLEAGKHVMCEKPLAMDSRQSANLVALAKQHNRVGGVTYNLRFYPLCQQARTMVKDGAIGTPRLVHGSFLQDWLFYDSDWNWRLDPKLGGELRAVSDIGTHWLDLMSWITGKKVTELCADLATVVPTRQRPRGRVETFQTSTDAACDKIKISTDDYASILLHFEDGVRGVMTVSQVSAGRKARLWYQLDGSKASLSWNSESPNDLWIGRRDDANGILPKDPALMSNEAKSFAAYPGGHAEGYPDTFAQLFRVFYDYIAAGDFKALCPFPTFETGHEEMVLCDAILVSAKERRWVKVSS